MNLHRLYIPNDGDVCWARTHVESSVRHAMADHGLSWASMLWAMESQLVVDLVCSPDTARGVTLDLVRKLQLDDGIMLASLSGEACLVDIHEHEAARDAYLSAQE